MFEKKLKTAVEVACYLSDNGFTPGDDNDTADTTSFFKGNLGILISGNAVDFALFKTERGGECRHKCSIYSSYTGVHDLDLQKWKMLLDITGMVPLEGIVLFEKD